MAEIIADNITTPLGSTTAANLEAVIEGRSALRHRDADTSLPFGRTTSQFSPRQMSDIRLDSYTDYESLALTSIRSALSAADIPLDSRTVLVLSSTKANVGTLGDTGERYIGPGESAARIAAALGLEAKPYTVCNACISGVSALATGARMVDSGLYDYAIVCGADVQSPFVISGFQSLKALSESECRPFDIERLGLNLGEGAATVILAREGGRWGITGAAVRNDAHHITNPSPSGEGCRRAIARAMEGSIQPPAQINAHGTATMYNDQMESKAISLSGLSDVPMNALKGYLGHTMGAAGLIETVLSIHALDQGIIIGTRGFEETGVSGKVDISAANRQATRKDLLKIISGFGGVNGAIHLSAEADRGPSVNRVTAPGYKVEHRVRITPGHVDIDGTMVPVDGTGIDMLNNLYKTRVGDYPKYYKMDTMARLGFLASELLLQAAAGLDIDPDATGVILCNSMGSYTADLAYLRTINDPAEYYPSPSLFVYTLPNIVTGEIAIRHGYTGETAFYILQANNSWQTNEILRATYTDTGLSHILCGWVEYQADDDYEADIMLTSAVRDLGGTACTATTF